MKHPLASAALTVFTYLAALALVAPIAWMTMTGFKTEAQAFQLPPLLVWRPTLENFRYALGVAQFGRFFLNSVVSGLGSTVLACLLGVPAAYSLAFYPNKRTRDVLFWILSTKMLPVVAVIVPLYVLFTRLHLLDTRVGMILLYTTMNLPLVIWMMRSFFAEIPGEIIEATQVDGASLIAGFVRVTLPLAVPGLVATMLLSLILAWNEFFIAASMTYTNAATLAVFISSFKTSEGLFWAKMSAASTLTIVPVLLAGWAAQRQLVRGLTMGAIKG
jgi:sorbitol/mannitol transport system permease protein